MEHIDLKRLRFENHLTQEELGKILGYTKQHIGRIESGQSKLSEEKIDIIKQHFPFALQNNTNKESQIIGSVTLKPDSDIINIPYWSELPDELKHPEYPYVLAQRVSIEKGWNVKPEKLCIITMVGDKMERYWYPMKDGDILIIDTSHNFIRGNGVYFATSRNNTRFWVREMQVLVNDDVEFKGFAPSGETTRVLSRKELEDVGFRIIGKVIKNVSFRL